MTTALMGLEAGISASVLMEAGLNFVTIPEGAYEIGAKDLEDNPLRDFSTDSFELADTVLTNRQMGVLMKQLEEKTTVVTLTLPNYQAVALARGTLSEIKGLSYDALEKAAKEVITTGKILAAGGFATFDLSSVMQSLHVVTLEHHLLDNFKGDDQPALVNRYEASAIAALLGLELPVDETWEVAAGDLRDEKYLNLDELRKVALFYEKDSKRSTEDVKSREPNRYGLYGMLGNVLEWMANPVEEDSSAGSLRGGSWFSYPANVRAAVRGSVDPGYWNSVIGGVRLSRPQDSSKL